MSKSDRISRRSMLKGVGTTSLAGLIVAPLSQTCLETAANEVARLYAEQRGSSSIVPPREFAQLNPEDREADHDRHDEQGDDHLEHLVREVLVELAGAEQRKGIGAGGLARLDAKAAARRRRQLKTIS